MPDKYYAGFLELCESVPSIDVESADLAREYNATLTKPAGSLGKLEEVAIWLSGWQGEHPPRANSIEIAIFATSHGVAQQAVSAYPASVTAQMMENFKAGGAAINQICEQHGFGLRLFDMGVDAPSGDISVTDAMEPEQLASALTYGMEATVGRPDLLVLGDMAIGNTAVAGAIYCALWDGKPIDWVGAGTGVAGPALDHKREVVARALSRVGLAARLHPLEILARLGGREIAGIVGAIVAARRQRIPVLLDGFVVTAGAAILHAISPNLIDHCLAGHLSAEGAHKRALEHMAMSPLLDLGMRLGEGSGGALAASLVRSAVQCHRGMASFDDAGVSRSISGDSSGTV